MTREEATEILHFQTFVVDFQTGKALEMAISALRQEETVTNRNGLKDDVIDTNVGKWISVKDRLPDEDGRYLVTECVGNMLFLSIASYTHNYDGLEDHLLGRAMWYDCDSEYGDFEKTGITHWMPLPEKPEEGTV